MHAVDASARRRALLELHLGAVLLGGSALLPRFVPLPVGQLVLLRSLIAALLLFALALAAREPLRPRSRGDAGWLLLCAVLLGLHWLTYFRTIQLSTVALGSVCFYTFPVITVFLEPLFGRTRLRAGDAVAAALALAGVVLVARPGAGAAAGVVAVGLSCAVFIALRNVLYRHHLPDYPPVGMTAWQFLIVGVLLLPAFDSGALAGAPEWGWKMLVFGVFFTAAPHLLFVRALRSVPAKSLGLVTSLTPLYATLFAWLAFREVAGWSVLAGGALIVGAAAYESLRPA